MAASHKCTDLAVDYLRTVIHTKGSPLKLLGFTCIDAVLSAETGIFQASIMAFNPTRPTQQQLARLNIDPATTSAKTVNLAEWKSIIVTQLLAGLNLQTDWAELRSTITTGSDPDSAKTTLPIIVRSVQEHVFSLLSHCVLLDPNSMFPPSSFKAVGCMSDHGISKESLDSLLQLEAELIDRLGVFECNLSRYWTCLMTTMTKYRTMLELDPDSALAVSIREAFEMDRQAADSHYIGVLAKQFNPNMKRPETPIPYTVVSMLTYWTSETVGIDQCPFQDRKDAAIEARNHLMAAGELLIEQSVEYFTALSNIMDAIVDPALR